MLPRYNGKGTSRRELSCSRTRKVSRTSPTASPLYKEQGLDFFPFADPALLLRWRMEHAGLCLRITGVPSVKRGPDHPPNETGGASGDEGHAEALRPLMYQPVILAR